MSPEKTSRVSRMRSLCAVGLLACTVASFGVDRSRAESAVQPVFGVTRAHAARVESVDQTLALRVTKIQNTTIEAEGRSSNEPIIGTLKFDLTLVNASRGKANFVAGNSGGTIRGVGVSNYHASGSLAYFKGSITSLSGTGKYAHYRSLGFSFSGTLNRRVFRVSVTLVGKWSR
jgi:hypothetical protein